MKNMGKSYKGFIKGFIITVIVLLLIILIAVVPRNNINKIVTMEAGGELPDAGAFFKDYTEDAEYVTDMTGINLNEPGIHDIEVRSGKKTYRVKLEIKDTIPPDAEIEMVDIYESRTVEPHEFIKSVKDATEVTITYKTEPDYGRTGSQQVVLILEDMSGNKSEYQAVLRISKVKRIAEVDISEGRFDVGIFLKEQKDIVDAEIVDTLFPDTLGVFPVKIRVGDTVYDSAVEIVDKIPPVAKAVNRKFWTVDDFSAMDFVEDIVDSTKVTARFEKEPDLTQVGDQTVSIILTDEGGNETKLEAILTLEVDTEPPRIYGVQDTVVYLNTPVAYKKGVYVIDNRDTDIEVSVDSSRVNIKKEGSYKVIYTAVDASGNRATREVTYTVKEKPADLIDPAIVEEMAREILDKIITEDMTMREKALAIYKYVNKNVYYLSGRHSDDLITEAYYALKKDPGDCYTFFAASDLLLNMAGIPNIRVERLRYEGETNHYWHMINCGDGWYHFDACIHKPEFFSFMLTDAEAEAYSRQKGKNAYYYRHDKSKYPATPDK
ncbi:MAG: transglutaminase [Clostridiaceae bacterium]|nr:transglutaminase [Clostridiaceae bacterium]